MIVKLQSIYTTIIQVIDTIPITVDTMKSEVGKKCDSTSVVAFRATSIKNTEESAQEGDQFVVEKGSKIKGEKLSLMIIDCRSMI